MIWHYFKLEKDLHHQKIYYGTWKWWLAQSPWARFSMFKTSIYSRQILGLVSYHETGWKIPCCGCAGSEGLCHYWHLFCLCLFVWLPKKYITKLTPWNLTYINTRNSIWKENGLEIYLIEIIHHFLVSMWKFRGCKSKFTELCFGSEMQWKTVVEEGKKMEVHWKLYSAGLLFFLLHGWSTPLSPPTPPRKVLSAQK